MQPVLQFFLYIFTAYGLAAVLLVPLGLPVPVDKLIQRGGMILVLLSFWPFLKILKLNDRAKLGYGITRALLWKTISWGLLLGAGMLLCLTAVLLWLEVRVLTPGIAISRLPSVITEGLLAGLIVAFIEETFFRGGLFAALRRQYSSAVPAILGSSLLYAILHFLRPQPLPEDTSATLNAAFLSLAGAVPNVFGTQNLDALAGLFMAGVLLALVRERTGHLGWVLGLHAGWILVIKLSHTYTDVAYNAPWVSLVSHYDGMTGWLAAIWVGLLTLLVAYGPNLIGYTASNNGSKRANSGTISS